MEEENDQDLPELERKAGTCCNNCLLFSLCEFLQRKLWLNCDLDILRGWIKLFTGRGVNEVARINKLDCKIVELSHVLGNVAHLIECDLQL